MNEQPWQPNWCDETGVVHVIASHSETQGVTECRMATAFEECVTTSDAPTCFLCIAPIFDYREYNNRRDWSEKAIAGVTKCSLLR